MHPVWITILILQKLQFVQAQHKSTALDGETEAIRVRLNRISIKNFLGIEHLETEVGSALTVIEGGNGAGKTSVLEAFRAALGGGHDATLLRNGTTKGEVVLIFDDATAEKIITPEKSALTVKLANGGKISQPQTYFDRLSDVLALNPVTFLTAAPKDRTKYLLETVPINLSGEEISSATGRTVKPNSQNGFEVLASLQKQIASEKTATSRAIKEKEISIRQFEAALPPDVPEGESVQELRAQQAALESDMVAKRDSVNAESLSRAVSVKADLQLRLDELNRLIAEARSDAAAQLSAIEREASSRIQAIKDESAATRTELAARLSRAEELAAQQKRAEGVRQTIEGLTQSVTNLRTELATHESALAGLEDLRKQLLHRLPIPGLEIRDGEIYFKEIPFDRLNQAQRVKIALKLASLRVGALGLVCVDGFECLDVDTWKAFCDVAPKTGLQLIVTRVTEGPLKITRINSEEVAA